MMGVHHTGDTVEPESVKHEDVHIVSQIRQQESENFVMAVVEDPRIPQLVLSLCSSMEVEMVGTIELVDSDASVACDRIDAPIQDVLARV
jgi:hypothetical protein